MTNRSRSFLNIIKKLSIIVFNLRQTNFSIIHKDIIKGFYIKNRITFMIQLLNLNTVVIKSLSIKIIRHIKNIIHKLLELTLRPNSFSTFFIKFVKSLLHSLILTVRKSQVFLSRKNFSFNIFNTLINLTDTIINSSLNFIMIRNSSISSLSIRIVDTFTTKFILLLTKALCFSSLTRSGYKSTICRTIAPLQSLLKSFCFFFSLLNILTVSSKSSGKLLSSCLSRNAFTLECFTSSNESTINLSTSCIPLTLKSSTFRVCVFSPLLVHSITSFHSFLHNTFRRLFFSRKLGSKGFFYSKILVFFTGVVFSTSVFYIALDRTIPNSKPVFPPLSFSFRQILTGITTDVVVVVIESSFLFFRFFFSKFSLKTSVNIYVTRSSFHCSVRESGF